MPAFVASSVEAVTETLVIGGSAGVALPKTLLVCNRSDNVVVTSLFCDADGDNLAEVPLFCAAGSDDVAATLTVTAVVSGTLFVFVDSPVEALPGTLVIEEFDGVALLKTLLVFNVADELAATLPFGDADGINLADVLLV